MRSLEVRRSQAFLHPSSFDCSNFSGSDLFLIVCCLKKVGAKLLLLSVVSSTHPCKRISTATRTKSLLLLHSYEKNNKKEKRKTRELPQKKKTGQILKERKGKVGKFLKKKRNIQIFYLFIHFVMCFP